MFDKFKKKKEDVSNEESQWNNSTEDLGNWDEPNEEKTNSDEWQKEDADGYSADVENESVGDDFDEENIATDSRNFDKRNEVKVKNKHRRTKNTSGNKTPLIILLGLIFVVILAGGGMMLLLGGGEDSSQVEQNNENVINPQNPDEDTVSDNDIISEKDIINVEKDDSSITVLTHYGNVKRIVNNKIIIRPDNSLSDTIFFIDEDTKSSRLNLLESEDRIQYTYKIEDSKNIFVDFLDVYRATVVTVGENNVTLIDADENLLEYSFSNDLKEVFVQVSAGDIIEYAISGATISGVSNIIKPDSNGVSGRPDFVKKDNGVSIVTEEFNPADWTEELESIENQVVDPDYMIKLESDYESNSVKFYNSFDNPIWIRFAWRINEYTVTVPAIEDVGVSLITPKGDVISSETISEYGRMWVDGNIINFAIEKPEVGEWTLRADKEIGFYLGETQFMLMELTGFITVNKFGVNNLGDGQLEFIWNIGGVEDDNYAIEIYLSGEKFSTKVFSANSKLQDLKLIDHTTFNAKSLPRGEYDIIVKVQDLDIYTAEDNDKLNVELEEHVRQVGAETIIHEYNAGKLTVN